MYFERIPRFWTTTMTGGWPLPRRPRRPGQNYNSIHHHHHHPRHHHHHHHHHNNNNNNNVQLNTYVQCTPTSGGSLAEEVSTNTLLKSSPNFTWNQNHRKWNSNHALDTWILRCCNKPTYRFFQTPRYDPRKKSGRITRKPLENQDSLGRHLVDWSSPICIQ